MNSNVNDHIGRQQQNFTGSQTDAEFRVIRNYLLGTLSEAEQDAFEEKLLSDPHMLETLQVAEDDLMEDYLSRSLSPNERKRFDDYFLASNARKKQFAFHQGVIAAIRESQPPRRRWLTRYAVSALAAAAAVIIAVLVWLSWAGNNINEGAKALNEAYRNERPVEGRISGLAYADYLATRGNGVSASDKQAADRAEAEFNSALAKNPGAALHGLGQCYLAKHDFSKAVEELEAALKIEPTNVPLLSDLGLAYLEKAKHEPRETTGNDDLKRSLDYLNRAVAADGNLLDAIFNRALLYQELGQTENERRDWKDYVVRDPNSGWGRFAADQLKKLDKNAQP